MRTLPRFVPLQFVFGLLSLSTISFSLPTYASSVAHETETGETAMSFEFGDNFARMNAGEDNYFLLSGNEQYMVSRSEDGWQVLEIGSMTKALVSYAAPEVAPAPMTSPMANKLGTARPCESSTSRLPFTLSPAKDTSVQPCMAMA